MRALTKVILFVTLLICYSTIIYSQEWHTLKFIKEEEMQ